MILNKKLIIFMITLLLIFFFFFLVYKKEISYSNKNILEYMVNGLEDFSITKFYKKEINDVQSMGNGVVKIKCYDVDLNNDGLIDKLVSIRSPIHSGSYGDTFEILENNGEEFNRVLTRIFRLYSQEADFVPISSVHILKTQTNGFYDIEIDLNEEKIILKYQKDGYQ